MKKRVYLVWVDLEEKKVKKVKQFALEYNHSEEELKVAKEKEGATFYVVAPNPWTATRIAYEHMGVKNIKLYDDIDYSECPWYKKDPIDKFLPNEIIGRVKVDPEFVIVTKERVKRKIEEDTVWEGMIAPKWDLFDPLNWSHEKRHVAVDSLEELEKEIDYFEACNGESILIEMLRTN